MRKIIVISLAVLVSAPVLRADYKDDIGFTRLQSVLGSAIPDGTNLSVSLVEGPLGGNYMPDTNNVQFAGKRIQNVSGGSTNVSSHATTVARHYFGRTTSITPEINNVDVFNANDWLGTDFLNTLSSFEPGTETNAVQNHSWISSQTPSVASNMIQRLDYAIGRDGFVCVGGLNNGPGAVPDLMAHSYNSISVGITNGNHSYGTTTVDGPGRTKPEMVAPGSVGADVKTSWATPMVSAAAAFLLQHARDNPALTNAMKTECIKALLMGGATKQEFSDWDRTHSRPIDDIYGAGELNIYNSYFILDEGEQSPGSSSEVPLRGWDYGTITPSTTSRYFFAVDEGSAAIRVSAMLTWNRQVTDGPGGGFDPVGQPLPNLDLRLYSSSGFVTDTMLDWSTSAVDNVEHIYAPNLHEGQYALEVVSDTATNYAFAWRAETVDIPRMADVNWTNSSIEFELNVSTNYSYTIEATTNLLDPEGWTPIATSTPPASPYYYVDTESSNYVRRYYRVRLNDSP